jgi:hypothetical protein
VLLIKLWLITAMLFLGWRQATEGIDTVLERAAKVARFAFGGTGYAGVISDGEQDYKSILAHKSALADFEKLYSQGNLQAKCYALVGINKLNPARFKELARRLRTSNEKVATMHGCILFDEAFADVIRQIESSQYSRQGR